MARDRTSPSRMRLEESPMIDYEQLDGAVGQNWYDLDPDLRTARSGATARPRTSTWADAKLDRLGELVGDPHRPQRRHHRRASARARPLRPLGQRGRRDRPPPGHARLEARAVGVRATCRASPPTNARAGGRRPASCVAGAQLPLSQADTGLVCSLGMTSGVAGLVDAYAPARRARRPARRPAGRPTSSRGDRRVDVPHRARRRLRPRPHGALHGARHRRRPRADRRREVVLLEHRRRRHRAAGPARGRAGRPGRARPLPRARVPRGRVAATRFTIRRLKHKLGTKSVPTGEVEFHGALGYALRRARRTGAGGPGVRRRRARTG